MSCRLFVIDTVKDTIFNYNPQGLCDFCTVYLKGEKNVVGIDFFNVVQLKELGCLCMCLVERVFKCYNWKVVFKCFICEGTNCFDVSLVVSAFFSFVPL